MSILIRPPGDEFTFRLFFKLAGRLTCPKDLLYIWSPTLDPTVREKKVIHPEDWHEYWIPEHEFLYRQQIADSIKNDLVVIGVKDHLTPLHFNPWVDEQPIIARYLEGLFEYFPNKKFILFTSVENLKTYISADNVTIIPWGGDITNHQRQYLSVDPVLDKNFQSDKTFVALNRNMRHHRCMLLSLLYGLDIQHHGIISCLFKDKFDNLFDCTGWQFTVEQLDIRNTMAEGFETFKSETLPVEDSWDIYNDSNNDNVSNFKNKLSNYYKNSFVEIVTETSYTEQCFNLTEKTLNSIYGCNFPIIISSPGVVAFLRTMGMDVFDDIIDHSYDTIENPIDRIYQAVTSNIELLTDSTKVKELWKQNEHRFIKNIDFARTRLYNFYTTRTTERFNDAIEKL